MVVGIFCGNLGNMLSCTLSCCNFSADGRTCVFVPIVCICLRCKVIVELIQRHSCWRICNFQFGDASCIIPNFKFRNEVLSLFDTIKHLICSCFCSWKKGISKTDFWCTAVCRNMISTFSTEVRVGCFLLGFKISS
ncbi:Uncharacterised protein [Streptococcus pneumoniae]|nr:Uncharacterised protein [Streptococcus pneumoniae]